LHALLWECCLLRRFDRGFRGRGCTRLFR
jgi:hypothetical protein